MILPEMSHSPDLGSPDHRLESVAHTGEESAQGSAFGMSRAKAQGLPQRFPYP